MQAQARQTSKDGAVYTPFKVYLHLDPCNCLKHSHGFILLVLVFCFSCGELETSANVVMST